MFKFITFIHHRMKKANNTKLRYRRNEARKSLKRIPTYFSTSYLKRLFTLQFVYFNIGLGKTYRKCFIDLKKVNF